MKARSFDFYLFAFWFVVMFVATIVAMVFGAWYAYTDMDARLAERAQLRGQCIAGNDRACRIYEVDYGDGASALLPTPGAQR